MSNKDACTRQEYWSGLLCPPPGDLPHPGIKPMSLMSPPLAGGFFTHWATWEAPRSKDDLLQCDQRKCIRATSGQNLFLVILLVLKPRAWLLLNWQPKGRHIVKKKKKKTKFPSLMIRTTVYVYCTFLRVVGTKILKHSRIRAQHPPGKKEKLSPLPQVAAK